MKRKEEKTALIENQGTLIKNIFLKVVKKYIKKVRTVLKAKDFEQYE